jgi:hypothetical protein
MLEEYDLRNSKVVSNSHLRNRGRKKKVKNLKLMKNKINFFRHEAFDTVFWNPAQEEFIINFLNYFEDFLKDFVIDKNRKSRKGSKIENIKNNHNKQETPDMILINKFINTHKKTIFKRLLRQIKQELAPFSKFYSDKKKNYSIPYGSIPNKNELRNNIDYDIPHRLINSDQKSEWESIKRKEVLLVECENERIFDNSKKVIPVSIKGVVSKRQKVTYKGVDKKNYPKFGFLAQESEFLLISLNMNDLLIRIIFFFWEFIMDFKNLEMDQKFLNNILRKTPNLKFTFRNIVTKLAEG